MALGWAHLAIVVIHHDIEFAGIFGCTLFAGGFAGTGLNNVKGGAHIAGAAADAAVALLQGYGVADGEVGVEVFMPLHISVYM